MSFDECVDVGCRCWLADEVGDVKGEKVARSKEAIDGRGRDVVGVAKIRQLPPERFDGGVGGLARREGLSADDHVFAVRLVPHGNDLDATLESLDAGLQLRFGLV